MKAQFISHKDVNDKLTITGLTPGDRYYLTSNSETKSRKVKVNNCGYAVVRQTLTYIHKNIVSVS